MYYVWLGISLWGRERFEEAFQHLSRALTLGEEIKSKQVIGYANACLPWVCVELGLLKEAIAHGDKAREMSDYFESDYYPYYQSMDSDAYAFYAMGECAKILDLSRTLRGQGEHDSSTRSVTWGYAVEAWGHLAAGDLTSAIRANEKALETSADPLYGQFPNLFLGISLLAAGQYERAMAPLQDVLVFARNAGCELLGTPSEMLAGIVSITQGDLREGFRVVEDIQKRWSENNARWRYTFSECLLGELFLGFVRRSSPISLSSMIKNLGFLLKNLPFAGKKAEGHYRRSIEAARDIGALGLQGQAHLGLGQLYVHKGRKREAGEHLGSAVQLFEQCKATAFLEQARQALEALG
jgi:tetratricopeptide (TPR) repeat protein